MQQKITTAIVIYITRAKTVILRVRRYEYILNDLATMCFINKK